MIVIPRRLWPWSLACIKSVMIAAMVQAMAESDMTLSVAIVIAFIGELLAIIFVARILTHDSSPSTTLSWVLIILAAPFLGLGLYYLLPRQIHIRRLRRRQNRLSWIESSLEEVREEIPAETHADPLARLLSRLDQDAIREGNSLTLLQTGRDFFEQARHAIENAEHFVHLETYIFRPDQAGMATLELLTAAAARGVEVRLLYDSVGSWGLKQRHLASLVAAGGKEAAYLRLLWRRRPFTLNFRNHRKLLVVDGHTAILGGRNIGDEYVRDRFRQTKRKWLDSMIKVEGPAVRRLHRVFVEDWYNAAEEDLATDAYLPIIDPVGPDSVATLATGPDQRQSRLLWVYLQMIGSASRTIDISTPYLVPDPMITTALQMAAYRGVRVRIHTNGREAVNFILYRAQRSYYRALLAAGIEITETRGDYNHAKMVIVDDRYFLAGSPNTDRRSMELNFEISVIAVDSEICKEAAQFFVQRLVRGREVSPDSLRSRRLGAVFDGLCRLTSPLL
jgi:cardiolipin synthase